MKETETLFNTLPYHKAFYVIEGRLDLLLDADVFDVVRPKVLIEEIQRMSSFIREYKNMGQGRN